MARYRGPRLRVVRRLEELPGLTRKKISEKKENKTPGQHGKSLEQQKKQKPSAYKIRLYEKQKLRYNYGITESQLLNYVKEAKRKKGLTGFLLLQLLEMRLDNILYRIGIAPTIPSARQMISHCHVIINNKKVNIPSFQCQPSDLISFDSSPKTSKLIERSLSLNTNLSSNNHLKFHKDSLTIEIINLVERQDVTFKVNDMLVIEYYSRLV